MTLFCDLACYSTKLAENNTIHDKMDSKHQARGIKRPRTTSKGTKVVTASKQSDDISTVPNTARSNAAPIIQALKCMSSDEEARFEAFRRCSLPISAVTKLVVAFLAQAIVRRSCMEMDGFGTRKDSAKDHAKILPKIVRDALTKPDQVEDWNEVLQSLVLPKSSREIAIIVSSLTKMYAQRVVTAACEMADEIGHSGGEVKGELLPSHLFEAHLRMPSPIFYLDSNPSIFSRSLTTYVDSFKSKADAAMAAQAEFDKDQEQYKSEEKEVEIDMSMLEE